MYLSLDLDRATYQTLTETYRQAITSLQADALNPIAEALEFDTCVTQVRRIQALWHTGSESERRAALHELFEHLVIDLDTGRIADFRVKSWADRFLKAWSSYCSQQTVVSGGKQSLSSDSQVILSRLYTAVARTLYIPISEQRKARNRQLCERYAAGEILSDLAREFHLSVQRVHQIIQEEQG